MSWPPERKRRGVRRNCKHQRGHEPATHLDASGVPVTACTFCGQVLEFSWQGPRTDHASGGETPDRP